MMKLFLCLLISSLFCLGTAAAMEVSVVTLHGEAHVCSDRVYLGDIAKIEGSDAGKLAGIYLIKAPEGRIGARLSSDYISGKIRDGFIGPFLLKGAKKVNIKREYVRIPAKRLERLFEETVLSESPWKNKGRIVIEDIKISSSVYVLKQDKDAVQAKISPHEDFLGHTSIGFSFGKGAFADQAFISGRIRVIADVPVAKTTINRGGILTESDLEVRSLDISRYPRVATDVGECVGKRAKTRMRKGMPLVKLNLEEPPLISRGDVVYIEARAENLVIRDKGEALKDGHLSQQIPVRYLSSGKQIVGTIIAASCIAVHF